MEHFDPLFAHIRRFIPFSDEDAGKMALFLGYLDVKKKEHLVRAGKVCNAHYFILKGCLRTYFFNELDHEQTLQFAIEDWWLTDHFSYESGKPSQFYMQAVEPSSLAVIPASNREQMFAELPQLERYFRIILQRAFAASQMRIKFVSTLSGKERYRQFFEAHPEFIQRVPQYMLASYLGFSAEFLSKIRSGKA